VNARETVEAATPAAFATSVIVARRRWPGGVMAPVWQIMANGCHVTGATLYSNPKPLNMQG
jgi:hypothetical protein